MTVTRIEPPRPTWDVARLYPDEGQWEESDYLELTQSTNRLVELADGFLTVLPIPTTRHQLIVQFLLMSFLNFTSRSQVGTVVAAPLRVRLWGKTFREPDLVFMLDEHASRVGEDFWDGADLVMEVVSGSAKDRRRDLVTKRREYAIAGISEYWIIDPQFSRVTVLKRRGKSYAVHVEAKAGELASSALLKRFSVSVDDVLEAGNRTR